MSSRLKIPQSIITSLQLSRLPIIMNQQQLLLSTSMVLIVAAALLLVPLTNNNNNAYADHIGVAQNQMFQEYCLNYQYTDQPPNNLNVQCEETKQACEQRYAEFAARKDLQPTSDCYKADVGRLATVYCVNYQYSYEEQPNPNNAQCESTMEACEQRYAEFAARKDLQPTSDCYKHEKQYVNFSEHPYLEQYR